MGSGLLGSRTRHLCYVTSERLQPAWNRDDKSRDAIYRSEEGGPCCQLRSHVFLVWYSSGTRGSNQCLTQLGEHSAAEQPPRNSCIGHHASVHTAQSLGLSGFGDYVILMSN